MRIETTSRVLEAMFDGWDTVRSFHDDSQRQWHIHLSVSDKRIEAQRTDELVAELWPAKPKWAKQWGVRFRGRLVGRWRLGAVTQ